MTQLPSGEILLPEPEPIDGDLLVMCSACLLPAGSCSACILGGADADHGDDEKRTAEGA